MPIKDLDQTEHNGHAGKPRMSMPTEPRHEIYNNVVYANTKIGYQHLLSLNAGQKYCRMLLQYFRPSLSYHFPLRPLFCLLLSGRLRQVYCTCTYR